MLCNAELKSLSWPDGTNECIAYWVEYRSDRAFSFLLKKAMTWFNWGDKLEEFANLLANILKTCPIELLSSTSDAQTEIRCLDLIERITNGIKSFRSAFGVPQSPEHQRLLDVSINALYTSLNCELLEIRNSRVILGRKLRLAYWMAKLEANDQLKEVEEMSRKYNWLARRYCLDRKHAQNSKYLSKVYGEEKDVLQEVLRRIVEIISRHLR